MFTVSGAYQSQKKGLFPFNPPLRGELVFILFLFFKHEIKH